MVSLWGGPSVCCFVVPALVLFSFFKPVDAFYGCVEGYCCGGGGVATCDQVSSVQWLVPLEVVRAHSGSRVHRGWAAELFLWCLVW